MIKFLEDIGENVDDANFLKKILFIYWQTERERATQAGGAAKGKLSREGVQSQDHGIMTWAKGRCLTHWATHTPQDKSFFIKTQEHGASGWLSGLSLCLRLRLWSQGSGIEPHIGLFAQQGACSHPLRLPTCDLSLSNK